MWLEPVPWCRWGRSVRRGYRRAGVVPGTRVRRYARGRANRQLAITQFLRPAG
eukprot:SAG11_NODE_1011_length_6195_cov_4.901247_1_plen_53_part_00